MTVLPQAAPASPENTMELIWTRVRQRGECQEANGNQQAARKLREIAEGTAARDKANEELSALIDKLSFEFTVPAAPGL